MRRIFLYSSLVFCLFITPAAAAHAQEDGGSRNGLLSGVLKKVESTVTETTESVGNVVGSAVEGVDQTVQDTVSFTKDTVETLIDPTTEQPVSKIVNRTVDFVEGTVDNVTPVVENTVETVHTTTSSVTGIVEELPEVPVVTPILDEVSTVVNKTTQTVSDTVKSADVEETVEAVEEIVESVEQTTTNIPELLHENETLVLPQEDEKPTLPQESEKPVVPQEDMPAVHEQAGEVSEQPVFESNKDNMETQNHEMVSVIDTPEVPESTEPIVDEDTTFIANEVPHETIVNPVKQVEKSKVETPAEQETPTLPIQPNKKWKGIPIAVTTGTTSVTSPVLSHAGNADVVAGVVAGFAVLSDLTGRQWVHADEHMRIQWVHAPPGQPPQSTPFLQANK